MNADLKRVREAGCEDSSPAKRRATVSSSDGDDDRMEDWMRVVEVKRKEAIYRQMLEYRRLHEQEVLRANELEAQKRVLEASVHAVEVCWQQLVSSIRDIAGKQDLGSEAPPESEPILDPEVPYAELDKALQTRLPLTRQLVTHFVELAGRSGAQPVALDLQAKCSKLEAESSALKSSSKSLQSQIKSLTQSRDGLQKDLQKAQKDLDRQRMEHDKAEVEWKETAAREREKGSATPRPVTNGSGHATPNGKVDDEAKAEVAGPGQLLQDTAELEQQAEARLKQLEALRAEHTAAVQERDQLRLLVAQPSESALRESPFFQIYLQQLSSHLSRATDLQARFESAEKKLDELRSNNFDFREAVLAEARTEAESLRQQMARKDADLVRLRGQRDDMNAELLERKTRETEKMKFAEEIEVLANARQERIAFLVSEVTRLKGKLGAAAGSEGYLAFLRGDGGIDGDYVGNLETKVSDLETRLAALTSTEVSDAAAAKAELEVAKKALAKYERILGPTPEAAEDVRALAERLQQADEARSKLELQLQEAEEATNALYTEVEGLSKLWEGLEQTMRTKVYELKDGELKMSRLATEKAKADNKYFQAMRTKEAIEGECKTAQRAVDKQMKLIERAQEVEKGLNAQIAAQEKGLTALKGSAMEYQQQLAQLTSEKTQLELRLQHAQASLADAQKIMHQRVADYAAEKAARDRLQEEVDAQTAKLKKLRDRQDAISAASGNNLSASEYQLKEERDKLWKLLRCSCCEQNFKQQVITRCMHTFCKHCLEQRIASRQRKCPACGVAFSKEEVQTLYWQ